MYTEKIGRFWFSNEMPPEMHALAQTYLPLLEFILPAWVQYCTVCWDDDNTRSSMYFNTDYEYRRCHLVICPGWLRSPDELRLGDTVHELLHSMTSILDDYAENEIKRLLPESEAPKYRESVLEELRMRRESMTQDLTALVVGMLERIETPAISQKAPKR